MFKSVFKSGIRATYDVSSNASFVNEPWHIYTAKHNTTGKLASVFIFDKAKFESVIHQLCSRISNTKNPKVIINECYELIKYEVGQMAKLKHPQILTIYEVLEETKSKFLFVTESVTDNLMTVDFEKLDELSIQKGLLEVCKGIQFLHNYCSIVHMNLQPSSVFINQQGDWKLTGFRFLQNLNEISPQERESFFLMNNTSSVPFMNLNMNFVAPELVIDRQSKLDFGNDIWSLGCLIYYIYNKGEYLLNCFDQNSISDFKGEFRKFETKFYNHRVSDLKYVLKDIPDQLYGTFPSILARYPSDRINIDQFIDSDYFNGSLIKVMWFVD
ncbi:kinase-like protein, partial [Yamadazyma tenuis ATCC 10573]